MSVCRLRDVKQYITMGFTCISSRWCLVKMSIIHIFIGNFIFFFNEMFVFPWGNLSFSYRFSLSFFILVPFVLCILILCGLYELSLTLLRLVAFLYSHVVLQSIEMVNFNICICINFSLFDFPLGLKNSFLSLYLQVVKFFFLHVSLKLPRVYFCVYYEKELTIICLTQVIVVSAPFIK